MDAVGIEPTTYRLRGEYSTVELHIQYFFYCVQNFVKRFWIVERLKFISIHIGDRQEFLWSPIMMYIELNSPCSREHVDHCSTDFELNLISKILQKIFGMIEK